MKSALVRSATEKTASKRLESTMRSLKLGSNHNYTMTTTTGMTELLCHWSSKNFLANINGDNVFAFGARKPRNQTM